MVTKTRLNYIISYHSPTTRLTYTVMQCTSKQAACRRAIKYWVASGQLKTQPATSSDWESSFEYVSIDKVW
jgi:hypothetical protein